MGIGTFEKIVLNQDIPDEQVEIAFNLLIVEAINNNPGIVSVALELLKEHRPELGGKIAKETLCRTSNEQLEEAFDLFAQEKDDKEMARRVISLWSLRPKLAEKIDEKYSLGIKESMDTEY